MIQFKLMKKFPLNIEMFVGQKFLHFQSKIDFVENFFYKLYFYLYLMSCRENQFLLAYTVLNEKGELEVNNFLLSLLLISWSKNNVIILFIIINLYIDIFYSFCTDFWRIKFFWIEMASIKKIKHISQDSLIA